VTLSFASRMCLRAIPEKREAVFGQELRKDNGLEQMERFKNRDLCSRDEIEFVCLPCSQNHGEVEWRVESGLTDYEQAVDFMRVRVEKIRQGQERELIWLVEHPPLYTAGTSAKPDDLIKPDFLPVFDTGRGGEYTYHGPGQRVVYVMLDLSSRKPDVRAFVAALEAWVIRTLGSFGIVAERREDRVGVWVKHPDQAREDKIAAIGIRLKKWVSFHGLAINVAPDLSHYQGIVPCGIADHGVTSLAQLGLSVTMTQLDKALRHHFYPIFGQ